MTRNRLLAILATGAALALIAAALLVAVAGCGNPPRSGTVLSKDGQPSHWHTWVSYEDVCVSWRTTRTRTGRNSYTSSTSCSRYTVRTRSHSDFIPAWWQLCLRADRGDTSHDATGCFDVPSATWSRYQIGDRYPDPR